MNKKILTGLIILGLIFVGSATYALLNKVLDINENNITTIENRKKIINKIK